MPRVFIGVGHGGSDPGAVGIVKEADANLNIALETRRVLEAHGVVVGISRITDEDDSLTQEIAECNAFGPDLAMEVHNNSGGGDGWECYVQTNAYYNASHIAAEKIQSRVLDIGQQSRGIKTKKNNAGYDYFGWLRNVNAPAVLCEGFFVDSADAYDFDTEAEQRKLGQAYALGALDYFGISTGFVDVPAGAYYADAVTWAVSGGITNGIDATHFGPEQVCSRAQAVTFLWRSMGAPEPAAAANPFVDVAEGQYYHKAVLWALENGITSGVDAAHFQPDEPCTRAQIITFLWRAAKAGTGSAAAPFEDVAAGNYYAEAVAWAYANGIAGGVDATHFAPEQSCTRAQMVTFLYRMSTRA